MGVGALSVVCVGGLVTDLGAFEAGLADAPAVSHGRVRVMSGGMARNYVKCVMTHRAIRDYYAASSRIL